MTMIVLIPEARSVHVYTRAPELYVNYFFMNDDGTSLATTGQGEFYVCLSPFEDSVTYPKPTPIAADWLRFQFLKEQWHKERGPTSSTTKIVMSPSYQKILGMGPKALPYIFDDMRNHPDNPDHWFWALSMITGDNPIPVDLYGQHREMARVWLSWAEEHGVSIGGQQKTSRISTRKTVH
jgi:hypothetical protein